MDPHCHLHLHLISLSVSGSIPPGAAAAVLPNLHTDHGMPPSRFEAGEAGEPARRGFGCASERRVASSAVDPSWEAAQGDAAPCRRAARARRYVRPDEASAGRHHDFRGSTFSEAEFMDRRLELPKPDMLRPSSPTLTAFIPTAGDPQSNSFPPSTNLMPPTALLTLCFKP
ncbi:hypothetical protein VPH35_070483 [Triticum aestivum]